MRPGPRNPGESVADYNTRIKAMEAKWKAGMGGPKSGGTKAAGAGPVRVSPGTGGAGGGKPRGTTPTPPKPGMSSADPGSKTPAQLAKEAESRRIGIARGSIVVPRTPITAAQRKAENDRLMKIRGSDMPKAKPAPAAKGPAGSGANRGTAAAPGYGGGKPRRMMSGGMVKGKKK